jgi:hypothetical protein
LDSNESPKATAFVEKNIPPAIKTLQLSTQRHTTAASTINNSRFNPVQNETVKPVSNYYENSFVEKKRSAPKKMPEYVIHTGEIGFVLKQPETELLRKIRL